VLKPATMPLQGFFNLCQAGKGVRQILGRASGVSVVTSLEMIASTAE